MKMTHTLYMAMALLMMPLAMTAQTWEQVKGNNLYLYGEGRGSSIDEADKQALGDLISKIAVSVKKETKNNDRQQVKGDQLIEESQFESSVSTYANATLTNTERVIIQNEPDAHVGRWIKRSEIDKIFEQRIYKIKDMVSMGLKAETKGKVDDALRQLYWAFILLKSLQHPNAVTFKYNDTEHLLITWIPQKMNEIFDNIEARMTKREGNNIELFISYKGKPVNSIDYTYFDGKGWSSIYSARDGLGVLELAPGSIGNKYQLKYEFEYRGQARIDQEVEAVMNVVKSTPMRNAYANIATDKASNAPSASIAAQTFTDTDEKCAPAQVSNAASYQTIADKMTTAIRSGKHETIRTLFTTDGWDIYTKMIKYGNAKIMGVPKWTFNKSGDYVMGRGMKMAFSFKSGLRKSFVEDIVISFDSSMKICNVAFGLGNTAADDILNKGEWNEKTRLALMNFLENYKTAYGLKRLDYISSLFDDNAVIIVGKELNTMVMTKNNEMGVATIKNNKIIQKNRYTKNQYLKNLAHCFNSNEYINIRFSDNDLRKLQGGGELYAIQIAQDYYSSSYGDKGYLFLMVDINDPDKPVIKVRTWQPDKDPNFGLYGPGDF
ncbi:MAG: hypothetical protein PUI72_02280 [Prevotellaceae bacterium]|nr:hypothetical protein [Prevotellaceae bacterium]MDY6199308.1 hypothetical protein [Prevotella sp.]